MPDDFLVLAKEAQEEMFGIDARGAEVAGFVPSEEDHATGAFCITLKHKSILREKLSHAEVFCGLQRRAAFPADYGTAVPADEWVGDFRGAFGAIKWFRVLRRLDGHQE
jgi:hypothetical protein